MIKVIKSRENLGERKIIEIIKDRLGLPQKMPIPFGDDVSAFDMGNSKLAVLKTDMLVDKTDVPSGMSLFQAARKAIVMNVSDFAAKGVKPLVMLVSLGLPRIFSEKYAKDIGSGLNAGAREYGAYIVGGDTNETSNLVISVSLFGIAEKNSIMLRSGAKPDDIVAVTGFFGNTSAGLKILLANAETSPKLRQTLLESVLAPHARLKEGLALSRTKAVTASIDSSDGLAWSLHEIARASRVGFTIDFLPIANEAKTFAEANKLDPVELTLYGGEEYELVLTIKPHLWDKAKETVRKVGGQLLPIGKVTAEKQLTLKINRKKSIIEPRGWEHFKNKV